MKYKHDEFQKKELYVVMIVFVIKAKLPQLSKISINAIDKCQFDAHGHGGHIRIHHRKSGTYKQINL